MTNAISELIANNVQTGKEQTKTNQYQSKDNGPSFTDILSKCNDITSTQERAKSEDARSVRDNSREDFNRNNKLIDNQNTKLDSDSHKKSVDNFKTKDSSNIRHEKDDDISSSENVRKSEAFDAKDKTDLSSNVADTPKSKITDDRSIENYNSDKEENSSRKDDSLDNDNQESASNNSSKSDDDNSKANNTNSSDIKSDTKTSDQKNDDKQIDNTLNQSIIANQSQISNGLALGLATNASPSQNLSATSTDVTNNAISDLATTNEKSAGIVATTIANSNITAQNDANAASTGNNQDSSTTKSSEDAKPDIDKKNSVSQNLSMSNTNQNIEKSVDELVAIKEVATEELVDCKQTLEGEVNSSLQVKVSNDVKLDADKKVNNKDLNELKDKTPLEQSMLSELDAEVSTSNQNSGGSFSKQQNASEQVVKLSIEPMMKTDNTDFANVLPQEKIMPTVDKPQLNVVQTPAKGLNQLDIMNQINDKLATFKSNTNDKIEIILKPENLGKVNVEIQSVKGIISATLVAENQQVKELLEKNIDSLRNNLNSQGLNLNNVSIKVEESSKSAFNNLNFGQGQFDSEANNNQQKSQNTYKSDYKDNMSLDGSNRGTEEGIISTNELKKDDSLHVGMVDYKV